MILLIEYMSNNMVFFGILFGSIALTILIYVAYSQLALRKPKRKHISEPTIQTPKNQPHDSQEVKPITSVESGIKVIDGEIATVFKAEQDLLHPMEEALRDSNASLDESGQQEELDNPDAKRDEPIETEQEDLIAKEIKKPLGKYHVMFRQSDLKWIVKRENSSKIVRALETQKEAISYATIKALTNDTSVVIHKKDGKIRKQNYTKSQTEDETES